MSESTRLQIAINVLTSPREAFAAIGEKPRFGLPMILIALLAATAGALYANEVDLGWLTEQQLRSIEFIEMSEAQIEQAVDAAVERGPMLSIVTQTISAFFATIIIFLVLALYLRIVTIFTRDGVTYAKWLGLACWASLPSVFDSIATMVYILTNNVSFMTQTDINPLTFGNLWQFDDPDAPASVRLLMFISPMQLWTVLLAVLGHKVISGKSLLVSAAVILVPLLLVAAVVTAII